jgi:hypothetical protein
MRSSVWLSDEGVVAFNDFAITQQGRSAVLSLSRRLLFSLISAMVVAFQVPTNRAVATTEGLAPAYRRRTVASSVA